MNGDTSAFPFKGIIYKDSAEPGIHLMQETVYIGLTKREWFAGLAMQAIIAKTPIEKTPSNSESTEFVKGVIRGSIDYADQMLLILEEKK